MIIVIFDNYSFRLTASFMRAKRNLYPDLPACPYFEKFDAQRDIGLNHGVYNLVSLLF